MSPSVLVLTALDLELDAVRKHLTDIEWRAYEDIDLEIGTIAGSRVKIAIGLTGRENIPAATRTVSALKALHPKEFYFIGIAGALHRDLDIGDVMVPTYVYSYEPGTLVDGEFRPRPRTWKIPAALARRVRRLTRQPWQDLLLPDLRPGQVRLHDRPIASGDSVINSLTGELIERIRRDFSDAAACDTESAGATHAAHERSTPLMVVRAISDRADGNKLKADRAGSQAVAAANAAAFTIAAILDAHQRRPASSTRPDRARRGRIAVAVTATAAVLATTAFLALRPELTSNENTGKPSSTATTTAPAVPVDTSLTCDFTIAFMGDLSDKDSGLVRPSYEAAKLAFARFNQTHPQCHAKLAPLDTYASPDRAAMQARDILGDPKLLGVIGGAFATETRKIRPLFAEAQVAMISPTALDDDLTATPTDVFFRLPTRLSLQGRAIGAYLNSTVKTRRLYVVTDSSAYAHELTKDVRDEVGDAVVGQELAYWQQSDFSAIINYIKTKQADAVAYLALVDGTPFIQQLRAAGITIPVIASDTQYRQDFLKRAAGAADGMTITCSCAPPAASAQLSPNDLLDNGSFVGEGYDAAQIFLQAVAAGKHSRADVLAYVRSYDRDGTSRHIRFTATGDIDPAASKIWAYTVQKGRLIPTRELIAG